MNPNKKYIRQAKQDYWLKKLMKLAAILILLYLFFSYSAAAQWHRCRPLQPSSISGSTTVTEGTTNNYSVTLASNVTSYSWSYPSGWVGSNTMNKASAKSSQWDGYITVTAKNRCGSSTPRKLYVTVVLKPTPPPIVCKQIIVDSIEQQTTQLVARVQGTGYVYTWKVNGVQQSFVGQSIPKTGLKVGDCICVYVNGINSPTQCFIQGKNGTKIR